MAFFQGQSGMGKQVKLKFRLKCSYEPIMPKPNVVLPRPKFWHDPSLAFPISCVCFVCFVALRPKSTAMVIAGRSVHLTTLFPGQA